MDAPFCARALKKAIQLYGVPEIFNTDQGCQFTPSEFTGALLEHRAKISMDGKGRWLDKVFVERLWRSVKYEEVYLKAYANVREAERSLGAYFRFYNEPRPHSSHDGQTLSEVYRNQPKPPPSQSHQAA
ncbi:MAG: transposase [Verrucomicrobia bacterium]|nr:MAG: transposase [Verrucomicrobiota bacterium]